VVRDAQRYYLGGDRTPTREELGALLGELLTVQARAWDWYAGTGFVASLDPAALMPELLTEQRDELRSDLERTDGRLAHMVDALGAFDEPGDVWKHVTGPLIAGECYGEPFCSDALVEAQGGVVHQSPLVAAPYMNLNQAARIQGEARAEWRRFTDDLEDRAGAVVEGVGLAGAALAVLVLGYLFSRGGGS
jgi:hypothetical protein